VAASRASDRSSGIPIPHPVRASDPRAVAAYCGLVIQPGDAELVTVGTGMLCITCVLAAPDPEPPDPAR
jgi:hypothetical protein